MVSHPVSKPVQKLRQQQNMVRKWYTRPLVAVDVISNFHAVPGSLIAPALRRGQSYG